MKLLISLLLACQLFFLCKCDNDVLIIGAGAAGIAAASKLEKSGINFKILEAESRIGGRINSVKFGSGYVDLGAEWLLHNDQDSDDVVYNLVKDLNVLEKLPNSWDFAYTGNSVDEKLRKDIGNFLENFWKQTAVNDKVSVKDLFLQQYNETILKKYTSDANNLKIAKEAITLLQTTVLYATDWSEVAFTQQLKNKIILPYWSWKGVGFKTLLDVLMQKYPKNSQSFDSKILLNKEVDKIKWQNSNNEVLVHTKDGSVYKAKYVLWTPSIGVLKENHNNIFEPALPQEKVKAIQNIGFGGFIKIALKFASSWWQSLVTDKELLWVWSEEDKANLLSEFANDPILDGKSWVSYFTYAVSLKNNPNVLMAWIGGPLVPLIEKLPKENIQKGILYTLREVYGKKVKIPEPEQITYSQWWTNPHFKGVWTYETVKGTELGNIPEILSQPLVGTNNKPVVLFAGEGVSTKYLGIVQGAVSTGFKEADKLISLLKQ